MNRLRFGEEGLANVPARRYAVCFPQFGPYHHARTLALKRIAGADVSVVPIQTAAQTTTYEWDAADVEQCDDLITLCGGFAERSSALEVFFRGRSVFRRERIDVAFLTGYWPATNLALLAAAKTLGIKTVMMNDSHDRSAKARGWKKLAKRIIVGRFDAALVAGAPHKRYCTSLGIESHKIFTGYDVVDNGYFKIRRAATASSESEIRLQYDLPPRYFLSLGRMVSKKNLFTVISAYATYVGHQLQEGRPPIALVLVGSGPNELDLQRHALSLGLEVLLRKSYPLRDRADTSNDVLCGNAIPACGSKEPTPGGRVYFYGFRQIDETPIFYSLADAFILASTHEEWGLVVNEAMACALPVVVSRDAGCAEDLLPPASRSQVDDEGGSNTGYERRANGYIFDPHSPGALAEVLQRLDSTCTADMSRMSLEIVNMFGCDDFSRQALAAADAASAP